LTGPIHVAIVDDHAVMRKGLRALLSTVPDIEVVGEAATGRAAVVLAAEKSPDVVLMDLVMPGMDGVEATRSLLAVRPQARVLVLTCFNSDERLFAAIDAGPVGFVLKDTAPEELIRAIRKAAAGTYEFSPAASARALESLADLDRRAAHTQPLSQPETDVIMLLARGFTDEGIARELAISEERVRTHIQSILDKLAVSDRIQAALFALREGMARWNEHPS